MDAADVSKVNEAIPDGATDLSNLWQFAGHGLRSSDFNTAMVHFYRGEVSRSNTWRARLDTTTNWAVVTTGAAISFAFSDPDHPPTVLLINTVLILIFLFIEARRYRYYELFSYRVRLMETNFIAGLLSPPFLPKKDWADKISESLLHPTFPISLSEAFGRRYRRNYGPIFFILAFSWIFKIFIHPWPVRNWDEFLLRSAVGQIPAAVVLAIGIIFNVSLIAMGVLTANLRQASGEVLGETPTNILARLWQRLRRASWEILEVDIRAVHLPGLGEQRKQLAYVISDEVEAISKVLMQELRRGVTMLHGTGMYTGKEHGVLMCALNARQLESLKRIVNNIDPHAFMIVTPVSEVRGLWLRPLEA
jgi:uncharacterized membrane protein